MYLIPCQGSIFWGLGIVIYEIFTQPEKTFRMSQNQAQEKLQ